jgi:hypothetical protein
MGGRMRLLLGALVLAAATFGLQAGSAGPLATDPLVQVSGVSAFAGCTADNVAGQPGTNFLNSEVEPWLDVNPTNPSNVVGIWQQDRWSNGGARGLVAGVSFDGGQTWKQVVIPKISLCSGGTAADGGDFLRATDPWVSFSPNGDLYAMSLSIDPDRPTGGFGKNAMLVSKSTDGGLTWSNPITLVRSEDPAVLHDKNSLTADSTDARFAYAVWDRVRVPVLSAASLAGRENGIGLGFKGPVMFSRTTNRGLSWEPARKIYDPGGNNSTLGSQIAVLPDGTVVNVFAEFLNVRDDDAGGFQSTNLAVIRSFDKGATWTHGPAIRAARMIFQGALNPDTGRPIRAEGSIPDVAVDPANGNLYAVWQDRRFRGVDEVAFAMSTDGGRTWSAPVKVNQTPASASALNQQAFLPSVHVGPNGSVAVTYYDFRNNTSDAGALTDYWIAHCHSACANGANWADENRLTNASFDIEKAPFARGPFGFFVGDYEGLSSVGTDFAALFSQEHGTDPASVFFRRAGQ